MGLNVPNRFAAQAKDAAGSREEYNLASLYNHLQSMPILSGRLVQGVITDTAGFNIAHGLERKWQGFILVNSDADVRVWATSAQTDKSIYINLDASASSVTIDLWVF